MVRGVPLILTHILNIFSLTDYKTENITLEKIIQGSEEERKSY